MKILAVCSTIDFKNFVRRATLEEIWRQHPQTDFLFYTGLKNSQIEKKVIEGPAFYSYHFWVPEKYKALALFTRLEYGVRKNQWRTFFDQYDLILLMDPNQYYLLEYVTYQKVIYLLRDPNILLNEKNYEKEKKILERSDLVLAISKELKNYYLQTYYNYDTTKVEYWPNSVDLKLWDYDQYHSIKKYSIPTAGISGNLTFKTDLKLLDFITDNLKHVNFVIIGKNKMTNKMNNYFTKITKKDNVSYKGYLSLEEVPTEIVKWHVGIMIERRDIDFSRYLNANKIYQYMAMGLPSVKYRYNKELGDYTNVVLEVSSREEYLTALGTAFEKSRNIQFQKECVAMAKENSAGIRAKDFMKWIHKL